MSNLINFPQGPIVDEQGNLSLEWFTWLQNPQIISINLGTAVGVTSGGTGLASGTSGGILGFTGATTIASSALLTNHALVVGGGAGATPSTPVGLGTTSTVLHGNAAGNPSWGAVVLTSDVSGTLPVANGGTGVTSSTGSGSVVLSAGPTLTGTTTVGTLAATTINGYTLAGNIANSGNPNVNIGSGSLTAGAGVFSGTVTGNANMLSPITASLGSDVALNNTAAYFDGPSIAQGSVGTWFVVANITIGDTAGAAGCSLKLWDGTTVIASSQAYIPAASVWMTETLSGFITGPVGNLRISVKDAASTSGFIKFNVSGNSKDSTITAIRIG